MQNMILCFFFLKNILKFFHTFNVFLIIKHLCNIGCTYKAFKYKIKQYEVINK